MFYIIFGLPIVYLVFEVGEVLGGREGVGGGSSPSLNYQYRLDSAE